MRFAPGSGERNGSEKTDQGMTDQGNRIREPSEEEVAGGPTGVAYYGGKGLRVTAGRASDPASSRDAA